MDRLRFFRPTFFHDPSFSDPKREDVFWRRSKNACPSSKTSALSSPLTSLHRSRLCFPSFLPSLVEERERRKKKKNRGKKKKEREIQARPRNSEIRSSIQTHRGIHLLKSCKEKFRPERCIARTEANRERREREKDCRSIQNRDTVPL